MKFFTTTVKAAFCALGLFVLIAAAQAAPASGEIGLSGNHLVRDGQPWAPRGVSMVVLDAPRAHLNPIFARWRGSFGDEALASLHAFHADLIRFQVSQAGLDPDSSIYDPAYPQEIAAMVATARAGGFNVIVSMQWEPPSGLAGQPNMPSQITQHAWATLVGYLKHDRGVMLELFNEPAPLPNPVRWQEWQQDMQIIVTQLRAAGARNVLLLDGLSWARDLDGAPAVNDPLNLYAYAIHPYFGKNDRDPTEWERRFGKLARSRPVLATEWFTATCKDDNPAIAAALLEYLSRRGIGLVGWSFDYPGTIFRHDGTLTDFTPESCAAKRSGAGALIRDYFSR